MQRNNQATQKTKYYSKTQDILKRPRRTRLKKRNKKQGPCQWCGDTKTPEWRNGPNGIDLCNACGLQYHLKLKVDEKARAKMRISNFIDPLQDESSLNKNSPIQNRTHSVSEQEVNTLNPVAIEQSPEIPLSEPSASSFIPEGFSSEPEVFDANTQFFLSQPEACSSYLRGLSQGYVSLSSNLEDFSSKPITLPSDPESLLWKTPASQYEDFSSKSAAGISNPEIFSTLPTDTHSQNNISLVKKGQNISVFSDSAFSFLKQNTSVAPEKPDSSSYPPHIEKNLLLLTPIMETHLIEPLVKHDTIDPFRQTYSGNSYFQKYGTPSSQFFKNSNLLNTSKSTDVSWDLAKTSKLGNS